MLLAAALALSLQLGGPALCEPVTGHAASPVSALTVKPEIWFAPPDDLERFGRRMDEDFSLFFTAPSTWSEIRRAVSTFELSAFFFARAPAAEKAGAVALLKTSGIGLNVSIDALPTDECGEGVEGMTRSADQPRSVALQLKREGADVKYFAFDEPLTFGHLYEGKNACRYSVEDVARRLALTVEALLSVYPDAKFVDYEVPNGSNVTPDEWHDLLRQWMRAYKRYTRRDLDVVVLDLQWGRPWIPTLRDTITALHEGGTKVGVFLEAEAPPGTTDETWIAAAKHNCSLVQGSNLPIDLVVFATWMFHPQHMLPESDPLSFSGLVLWYLKQFSHAPR